MFPRNLRGLAPIVLIGAVLVMWIPAGPIPAQAQPIPMAQGEVLYTSTSAPVGVHVYSPATGAVRTILTDAQVGTPLGIAVESPTSLLLTTLATGRLLRVNLETGARTILASGTHMGSNPDGVTVGLDGKIYVTELNGSKVIEVDPVSGAQRLVTSGNNLSSPIFVTPLSPTALAVTSSNARVVEVDIASGAQRVIASNGLLVTPEGIVLLPDGNLLVADYGSSRLVKVNPITGAQLLLSNSVPAAWGVALDGLGRVYVSRYANAPGLSRYSLTTGAREDIPFLGGVPFGIQVYLNGVNPPPAAPGPVASFTATDDDADGVNLQWSEVPEATSYLLFRDGLPLATLSAGDSTHTDVPLARTYEYCILAQNSGGNSAQVCDSGTRREYVGNPTLQFVADVPADQGGFVSIGWLASELDSPVARTVTGYRVWRRLPAGPAAKAAPQDALSAGDDGIRRRMNASGMIEYWEPILTVPSGFREGYGAVVATTRDSLHDDNPYTAYFVSALTADPFVFHDSAVDSGYSVDDLAPPTPPSLGGAYLAAGGVRLSWRESRAEDRAGYEVYRGTERVFDPAEDVLVGAPTDTVFTDLTGGFFHYKVLAIDVHGNRSAPALLSPLEIPTPAWILEASGTSDGSQRRIEVRLASTFGALEATVLRAESPEILTAEVLAERLAPIDGATFVFVDGEPMTASVLWYWVRATGAGSRVALAGPIAVESSDVAVQSGARHPSPNPSAGAVSMAFTVGGIDTRVAVRAQVVDATGRVVRTFTLGELPPGPHSLQWDGRNSRGTAVGAGVYRIRLDIGERRFSRSVVLRN